MKRPDFSSLPADFRSEYIKFCVTRLTASLALTGLSAAACRVIDFSGLKYPAMGIVFVLGAGVALSCLLFGLHRFFRRPWTGEILSVSANTRTRPAGNKAAPAKRVMVELEIDRGEKTPCRLSIFREDKHAMGNEHPNLYQIEAPYKEGDTLVFLPGFKVPARVNVKETETLLDPKFVCPYCGDVNPLGRKRCASCGRFMLH